MTELLAQLNGPGKSRAWIRAHLDYPHKDWCLLWPYSLNQYGYAHFGNGTNSVHRFFCEYRNGPPPTPKHQAAHECGRGHEGCVNQWHLSWKTNAENQLDRYRHAGKPMPQTKLTPCQVDEIRSLKGRARVIDMAQQFKVSPVTIREILIGKTWRSIGSNRRLFTPDEIHQIRNDQRSLSQLGKAWGVGDTVIWRIKNGVTYKYVEVTEPPATRSDGK